MEVISLAIIIFIALLIKGRQQRKEPSKSEKSFFLDGGDNFTDEDYLLMELMDDEDDF